MPEEPRLRVVGALADEPESAPGTVVDADLVRLDAELRAAGRQAERTMRGRTQPTRWYTLDLRERLLRQLDDPAGVIPR